MRALIQRVTQASVRIEEKTKAEIGNGLLILLGIEEEDSMEDVTWLSRKIAQLRIFDDEQGIMNLPITQTGGDVLAISQFTLHARTKKGNRPSYIKAAKPEIAIPLYEAFVKELDILLGKPVRTGEFGAYMQINLINDGPVTIWVDTKNKE